MPSNQQTLGNGCVCDSECADCDRLAEAFNEMKDCLAKVAETFADFKRVMILTRRDALAEASSIAEQASRAALAQADALAGKGKKHATD